uniref:CSON007530 protein n=1 Tax=Culicoides sonorensis TaxID=179676 RepID=A0A336LBC4_CULSO
MVVFQDLQDISQGVTEEFLNDLLEKENLKLELNLNESILKGVWNFQGDYYTHKPECPNYSVFEYDEDCNYQDYKESSLILMIIGIILLILCVARQCRVSFTRKS